MSRGRLREKGLFCTSLVSGRGKIACLILAVALVLGATFHVMRKLNNRALDRRLSIAFVTWTNTVEGELAVVLRITNTSRGLLKWYWMDPETPSNGQWPSEPRATMIRAHWEHPQKVTSGLKRLDGTAFRMEELAARQGTTVCVELISRHNLERPTRPTVGSVWRVPFHSSAAPTRVRAFSARIGSEIKWIRQRYVYGIRNQRKRTGYVSRRVHYSPDLVIPDDASLGSAVSAPFLRKQRRSEFSDRLYPVRLLRASEMALKPLQTFVRIYADARPPEHVRGQIFIRNGP
jgi:hypothetical protein